MSDRAKGLRDAVWSFVHDEIIPNESAFVAAIADGDRWAAPGFLEPFKAKAKSQGLWNLWLPDATLGAGLSHVEYAQICEVMGRSPFAPEAFNCSAPDTGNMEVLWRYGTEAQQDAWLTPLLSGDIRSCFAMTEPDVASSDATNIRARIEVDGDTCIINGRKWWTSGAGDPRCKICIFMGKTDPDAHKYKQQSMVLVPMDTPGITVERMLSVFGYDDAPHGHAEMTFENVRVPASNILLGPGRGFEIAQGRLGPGRIHHCMRLIGVAERALELMVKRSLARVAFGKPLAGFGTLRRDIATSRMEIEQARYLTLAAAHKMDTVGNKAAKLDIAMIKVVAPNVALRVVDRAIQAHGGAGVSQDTPLAYLWAASRTLRLADGPDEVHSEQVARLEIEKHLTEEQKTMFRAVLRGRR